MRKLLFLISVIVIATTTYAKFNNVNKVDACPEEKHIINGNTDYICSCGGKLKWYAKCFSYKKRCVSCHGRGILKSGKYTVKCSMCDGRGWYWEYKPGYICTSCHRKYQ